MCAVLSCFSCVWLCETPWTVARQAALSMGFSRQEYWSGLPFPSPGDLPNPGIEAASHKSPALAGGFFTTSPTWDTAVLLVRPLGQSWVTWYMEWQRDLWDWSESTPCPIPWAREDGQTKQRSKEDSILEINTSACHRFWSVLTSSLY